MKFAVFASNDRYFTFTVIHSFIQILKQNDCEYEIFIQASKKFSIFFFIKNFYFIGIKGLLYLLLIKSNNNKKSKIIDVNSDEFYEYLKKNNFDIGISIGFGAIIKSRVIHLFNQKIYNIHCSLLPQDKGLMPVFWSLANARNFTGVTLHNIDDNIDTGYIVSQKIVPILPSDSYVSLSTRLKSICIIMLSEYFFPNTMSYVYKDSCYNKYPAFDDLRNFRKKRNFI